MTTNQLKTEAYRQANLDCAQIVAERPDLYPGLMQEWAGMVLSKAENPSDAEAGPLFKTEAA